MLALPGSKYNDAQSTSIVSSSSPNKISPREGELSTQNASTAIPLPVAIPENSYEIYSYRYVVLLAYILIRFASGAIYGLFIPFSDVMRQVYGIKHIFVVLTGVTFSALSPLVNLCYANRIILTYGARTSVFLLTFPKITKNSSL